MIHNFLKFKQIKEYESQLILSLQTWNSINRFAFTLGELKDIPGFGQVLETRSLQDGKVERYPISTIGMIHLLCLLNMYNSILELVYLVKMESVWFFVKNLFYKGSNSCLITCSSNITLSLPSYTVSAL